MSEAVATPQWVIIHVDGLPVRIVGGILQPGLHFDGRMLQVLTAYIDPVAQALGREQLPVYVPLDRVKLIEVLDRGLVQHVLNFEYQKAQKP